MTIEELKQESDRLFAIYEAKLKQAEQFRDEWHLVYRKYVDAAEEEKIQRLADKKIKEFIVNLEKA